MNSVVIRMTTEKVIENGQTHIDHEGRNRQDEDREDQHQPKAEPHLPTLEKDAEIGPADGAVAGDD